MTMTFRTSETRCSYDQFADVLYVKMRDAEPTDGVDTERGFIVHYTWPEHLLAGVTIMDFRERFGSDAEQVEIDAEPPFSLIFDEQHCVTADH
jgi:hypothetical protein